MKLELEGVLNLNLASESSVTAILNRLSAIKSQLDRMELKVDGLATIPGATPPDTTALEAATRAAQAKTAQLTKAVSDSQP